MRERSLAALAILAVVLAPAFAQEQGDAAQQEKVDLAQKLKDNPNDVNVLREYGNEAFGKAAMLSRTDPKQALEVLETFEASLDAISPEDPAAKRLLASAKNYCGRMKGQIEVQMISMEDLIKKLADAPDDVKSIGIYGQKVAMEASSFARTEPEKAEAAITKAKELLAKIREGQKDNEEVVKAVDGAEKGFASLERTIAAAKKLIALIGQDAAPFEAAAWVNGGPLTDADLKGKVVMLDFWAVWCGPCVATFPHLKEWHEEYAEKGLVLIGVTNYYQYVWDDEAGRATRSTEEVTPEAEQEMLKKFAEHHDLHHPFAVQTDRELAEFYGVTGIPHIVVIDRAGKIRMIKVGSGPANAEAIGGFLKELFAE